MRKVQAFTLMELIVAMIVLSSLMFSVSWIFLNTQKILKEKNDLSEIALVKMHFYQAFHADLEQSDAIEQKGNDLILQSRYGALKTWGFYEENALRIRGDIIDTFNLKFIEIDLNETSDYFTIQCFTEQGNSYLFTTPKYSEIKSKKFFKQQ